MARTVVRVGPVLAFMALVLIASQHHIASAQSGPRFPIQVGQTCKAQFSNQAQQTFKVGALGSDGWILVEFPPSQESAKADLWAAGKGWLNTRHFVAVFDATPWETGK